MNALLLAATILVALWIGGAVGFITAGFLAWNKCRDEHYTVDQLSPDMVRVLDRMQADYAALRDAA